MEDNYNIIHYCSSKFGSSGGTIINIINFKVIGVHKAASSKNGYNYATFIKVPIKEFNLEFQNKGENILINKNSEIENISLDEDINEITIIYKNLKKFNEKKRKKNLFKEKIEEIVGEKISKKKIEYIL